MTSCIIDILTPAAHLIWNKSWRPHIGYNIYSSLYGENSLTPVWDKTAEGDGSGRMQMHRMSSGWGMANFLTATSCSYSVCNSTVQRDLCLALFLDMKCLQSIDLTIDIQR